MYALVDGYFFGATDLKESESEVRDDIVKKLNKNPGSASKYFLVEIKEVLSNEIPIPPIKSVIVTEALNKGLLFKDLKENVVNQNLDN